MKNIIIGGLIIALIIVVSSFVMNERSSKNITNNDRIFSNGDYCYVEQTPSGFDFASADDYDYKFLRFTVNQSKISGILETYPFATDSSRGTISGEIISSTENEIIMDVLYNWSAEGMTGTNEERIEIRNNVAYVGYGAYELSEDVYRYGPEGIMGWWEIPQRSCSEYDELYDEYQNN